MTADALANLWHVSDGLEACVLVCLHSILDDLAVKDRLSVHELSDIRQKLPFSKSEALERCIQSTQAVPSGDQVEAGLLPLLFVITCETEVPELRLEMAARVHNLANNFGIGNQRIASIILRQICLRKVVPYSRAWQNAKWKDLILT